MSLTTWFVNFIVIMTVVLVCSTMIFKKEEEIQRLRYQKVAFHFEKNCPICRFPVVFDEAIAPVRD